MSYERGDVVEVGDPFNEHKESRPFVIVNTGDHPFHGDQYIAVTLTTKQWYENTLAISNDDFLDGGIPRTSSIVPWGVILPSHSDVRDHFGRLQEPVVSETIDHLVRYLRRS